MADASNSQTEKTSDVYRTSNLPERFNDPTMLKGYQTKEPHPVFQTSSSVYGGTAPSIHTMPNQFHGRGNKFSQHLATAGMYTANGLNTALDKSVV